MAYFSSRGPRLGDGAVKPDVVAPGVGIVAARAAGTSLGDAGRSVLHVARRHLDGDAARRRRRRDPQAGAPDLGRRADQGRDHRSAVPVTGATAFDAGTGRVDAVRAIQATVFANGPLNLGSYPYPQSTSPPTKTPLTYTNLGASPSR